MANYTESGYDPSLNGYWKGTIDGASNFGYPKNYFFADTIRSIMIGFGNFFNDIKVIRYNKTGEPVKIIDVPIKYGPRQKSHDFKVEQESGETYYISLPNMTYKIDSIAFDATRASGIYEQRAFYNDVLYNAGIEGELAEQYWSDIQPVPYNITISMALNCEKMADINQVMEQILPRFAPAAFFNIKEFWWFNKRRSIKLKLNSPGIQVDSDAMGEEDRRVITGTFTFDVECWLYKPVKDAQIIELINTYLSVKDTDMVWHGVTYGNEDGSIDNKYNFAKIYDTGVMHAYVLKDGYPKTTYDAANIEYTTTYEYSASDQLVAYDNDSKIIKTISRRWIDSEKPELMFQRIYDDEAGKFIMSAIHHPVRAGDPILVWDHEMSAYRQATSAYSADDCMWHYKKLFYDDSVSGGEWYVTKEYFYPGSGCKPLEDYSVTFNHKILYDRKEKPYSAYYSQYSEEGSYTEKPEVYSAGRRDFLYSAWDGNIVFSGDRYPDKKNK